MNVWDKVRACLTAGWCKGMTDDGHGNHCVLGALRVAGIQISSHAVGPRVRLGFVNQAIQLNPLFDSRLDELDTYNRQMPREPMFDPDGAIAAGFNNHKDTTLEQVLSVVTAAEALEIFKEKQDVKAREECFVTNAKGKKRWNHRTAGQFSKLVIS